MREMIIDEERVRVFGVNEKPEYRYNNIFEMVVTKSHNPYLKNLDNRYFIHYIIPTAYKESLNKILYGEAVHYWFEKIKVIKSKYGEDLNYDDLEIRSKYLGWEYTEESYYKTNNLLRKKKFLESDDSYHKEFLECRKKHYDEYLNDIAKKIAEDKPEIVYPKEFENKTINNSINNYINIKEALSKELGYDVLCFAKTFAILNNIINIQYGTLALMALYLWYNKFPKQMVWWKFLGLESAESGDAYKLINNSDFYKTLWVNCDWNKDVDSLFDILRNNTNVIDFDIDFKITNQTNYDFLDHFIKSNIDDKMVNISKTINLYLSEHVSPNLCLASFISISDSYKLSELKSRLDKTKLLNKQYF